jgi:hypothetical protein
MNERLRTRCFDLIQRLQNQAFKTGWMPAVIVNAEIIHHQRQRHTLALHGAEKAIFKQDKRHTIPLRTPPRALTGRFAAPAQAAYGKISNLLVKKDG